MKIGLIGPANGANGLLDEALDFLLTEAEVDLLVYLGSDDAIVPAAERYAREHLTNAASDETFLARVAELAPHADVATLESLLAVEDSTRRLDRIRRLPPSPARAIEMLGDRILTLVWDKAVLAEEDIANAFMLVYGKSKELFFKRFGPRYFFTPGPLEGDRIAVLEQEEDGYALGIFSSAGVPINREPLVTRMTSKVTVSP